MRRTTIHPRVVTDKAEGPYGGTKVSGALSIPGASRLQSHDVSVVMITLGQVIAYGIGAGFFHVSGGWRWMVGLGAVPAGVQLVFLFFLPESRAFDHPYASPESRCSYEHTSHDSPNSCAER